MFAIYRRRMALIDEVVSLIDLQEINDQSVNARLAIGLLQKDYEAAINNALKLSQTIASIRHRQHQQNCRTREGFSIPIL